MRTSKPQTNVVKLKTIPGCAAEGISSWFPHLLWEEKSLYKSMAAGIPEGLPAVKLSPHTSGGAAAAPGELAAPQPPQLLRGTARQRAGAGLPAHPPVTAGNHAFH